MQSSSCDAHLLCLLNPLKFSTVFDVVVSCALLLRQLSFTESMEPLFELEHSDDEVEVVFCWTKHETKEDFTGESTFLLTSFVLSLFRFLSSGLWVGENELHTEFSLTSSNRLGFRTADFRLREFFLLPDALTLKLTLLSGVLGFGPPTLLRLELPVLAEPLLD
jgi:hypothetical protein